MIIKNSQIDLSVIIINYNLSKEIENCLDSFEKIATSINNLNYEIIIVDNNSPDQDLPEVEKKYLEDHINFYYLDKNLGFGKGCNYGYQFAKGEYVCFLNPDTIIIEDIFSPILKKMKDDKSIGIIGPKQQTQEPFFDFSAGYFLNVFFEFFALLGLNVFIEGFTIYLLTKINSRNEIKVNWILGACLFIRSKVFEEIHGFDKDYFMFYEEVDLCKKVSNKGYSILYLPNLLIHHIGSVSGKKNYKLYTIRTYVSKNLFIEKNYKSINKYALKILLYLQSLSQIIIWAILFPINSDKSKQKLKAFTHLLSHQFRNKVN